MRLFVLTWVESVHQIKVTLVGSRSSITLTLILTYDVEFTKTVHYNSFRENLTEWSGNEANRQPGQGPIWFDDIDCSGNETELDQCQHSELGLHNCTHDNDVYLSCGKGKLNI